MVGRARQRRRAREAPALRSSTLSPSAPSSEPAPEVEGADDSAPTGSRLSLVLSVAAVVLVCDQLTKHWAVTALDDGSAIDLIGSLRLKLTFNTGAAFSRGAGLGPLIAVAVVVIVGLVLWNGRRAPSTLSAVAFGAVAGGALGNLADRVLRAGDGFLGGGVVDFIDLQWWPVFNVADAAVVVGAIVLAWSLTRVPEP